MKISSLISVGSIVAMLGNASAATLIEVQFEPLGPVGFAPALTVAHDGTFDYFNAGSAASPEVELMAELGDVSGIQSQASSFNTTSSGAFPPGTSASSIFSVADGNNFVSFASMVLPSSDYFIGNDNPMAYDISSLLSGASTSLQFDLSTVWNAGTEVDDFTTGPDPFGLTGIGFDPPTGADENGVIGAVTGTDPFGSFLNAGSFNTTTLDFSGAPVGRFTLTVVPEPSSVLLLGLGGCFLAGRRRR